MSGKARLTEVREQWHKALNAVAALRDPWGRQDYHGRPYPTPRGLCSRIYSDQSIKVKWAGMSWTRDDMPAQPPSYVICGGCRFLECHRDYESSYSECECAHPIERVATEGFERAFEGFGADCWAFRGRRGDTPWQYTAKHGLTWAEVEHVWAVTQLMISGFFEGQDDANDPQPV